ncbi:unnamed protein product [Caenorhabditis auriculariae]|uniref:Uncharacterized protein n=1 Tax=Caenorhabditis auriculariae TaxID=2777116 RepID=A0A8S1HF55_9PELO|nr:unnamed protein product [Caenorhabditis auriculariae]
MELIDKTVELRGSQILNMRTYHEVVCQRRIMAVATILAWVGAVLLIVALATTNWAIIEFMNTDYHMVKVELGVWGEWRTLDNFKKKAVEWIPHFPSPPESILRLADADLKHYYRSQAAIGVIALIILLSTNLLALYTFYHHRYMYKRAVACLYFVVAMAIVVTIEILSNSIDEWNRSVGKSDAENSFNYDAGKSMGYSTRLAQAVVGICIFAAIVFAWASHKQKGDHAATAELEIEDRPIHMGR